jgi:hypothetical protein
MGLAYSGVLLSTFGELTDLLHLEGSTFESGLYEKFAGKRHIFERMLVPFNS